MRIARAALHMWEEPCISGVNGSGTIFFSGCPLKCVFCQNSLISQDHFGTPVTPDELRTICQRLIHQGAHNINLVTPTHFCDLICEALLPKLPVPVVWNTSGYERVSVIHSIGDRVQIYLTDIKYMSSELGQKYACAPDYPDVVKKATLEMFRSVGPYEIDEYGIMKKGVIIRHLMLPGEMENTLDVIDWVSSTFSRGDVMFSLMTQYTPMEHTDFSRFPNLSRRITEDELERVMEYMYLSGLTDGYVQDIESSEKCYIPPFDLSGIK